VLTDISRNLLPQYRSAEVAEIKVSNCKTPQCRKADHHILNFHRFENPKSHSYFLFFTAGIGYGQMFATLMVLLYYCSLMAVTGFYLVQSFAAELPWATCFEEWADICFHSGTTEENSSYERNFTDRKSSSELFF
jgi:hypothetical protein